VFSAAVPILLSSGYLFGAFDSTREQQSRQTYSDAVEMAGEAVDCISTVASLSLERHVDREFWRLITARAQQCA
jgi:hypothetical protein